MSVGNKEILIKANAAVSKGDNEGFLSFCTDDVVWEFVGDRTLQGKEAIREYMAINYQKPPNFVVENLIADDDSVVAVGKISMKDETGKMIDYSYCDIWHFQEGKMTALKAFVIKIK